jgi:hypothetical protein
MDLLIPIWDLFQEKKFLTLYRELHTFLGPKRHFHKKWQKIQKNLFCNFILEYFFRNSNQLKGIVLPNWKGLQMVSLDRFEV